MKTIAGSALILILMLLLFLFPAEAFQGASDGLLLWFRVLLPTLLPYMIFSDLLMSFLTRSSKGHPVSPWFALIGIFCGYPMGAKLCSYLLEHRQISVKEAQYLLPICNIAGPAFITGFVMEQTLHVKSGAIRFLLCIYLPVFLYALFKKIISQDSSHHTKEVLAAGQTMNVDECIMDSFQSVTKLGGYVILFSMLAHFILCLFDFFRLPCPFFLIGLLEITNGINLLTDSTCSYHKQLLSAVILIHFGGLSCVFQTYSMIRHTTLSIRKYVIAKIWIVMLSVIVFTLLF